MLAALELVAMIVGVVILAGLIRARGEQRAIITAIDSETEQLREEVRQLRERIHVLERIATDGSASLERQIDELRNR